MMPVAMVVLPTPLRTPAITNAEAMLGRPLTVFNKSLPLPRGG